MQGMKALFPSVEGVDECSAVGCACVPPRNLANGTHCTRSLRQTTHGDGGGPLKGRRGRDSDSCFSAEYSHGHPDSVLFLRSYITTIPTHHQCQLMQWRERSGMSLEWFHLSVTVIVFGREKLHSLAE
ncbi:hypothetical protein Y032_0042g506 [Ancylostoma ceylanicum]|uniref:Uncharacterized protein n=1 Tax=Ancylostoma ceylanicum TaxID=53326 RepID=A0A016UGL2_9BILA|nr:hypothetical protein Y032_0042g506 [Ancylostoma ceylanicum]